MKVRGCPICGSQPIYSLQGLPNPRPVHVLECIKESHHVKMDGDTLEEAARRWDQRAGCSHCYSLDVRFFNIDEKVAA